MQNCNHGSRLKLAAPPQDLPRSLILVELRLGGGSRRISGLRIVPGPGGSSRPDPGEGTGRQERCGLLRQGGGTGASAFKKLLRNRFPTFTTASPRQATSVQVSGSPWRKPLWVRGLGTRGGPRRGPDGRRGHWSRGAGPCTPFPFGHAARLPSGVPGAALRRRSPRLPRS